MKTCIIIPSRMRSVRLPNKPLADICGKPMVVHVAERAKEANIGPVYIAASELEVAAEVAKYGFESVMTDPDIPSGTDRVHKAYEIIKETVEDFDIIINLQGDSPLIHPSIIQASLVPFKYKDCDISTVVNVTNSLEEAENLNIVKAILSEKESGIYKALYFTRAKAPANDGYYFHHHGIYAFKADALNRFVSLPQSYLEKREKLEQLRALENDMSIYCNLTTHPSISVDTQEQLDEVRSILSK